MPTEYADRGEEPDGCLLRLLDLPRIWIMCVVALIRRKPEVA